MHVYVCVYVWVCMRVGDMFLQSRSEGWLKWNQEGDNVNIRGVIKLTICVNTWQMFDLSMTIENFYKACQSNQFVGWKKTSLSISFQKLEVICIGK